MAQLSMQRCDGFWRMQGLPSSAASSWDSRAYSGVGLRAGGRRQNRRASALEPHIQQCCCKAASSVADDLRRRLAGLPAAQPAEATAQTIEQALLVGEQTLLSTHLVAASSPKIISLALTGLLTLTRSPVREPAYGKRGLHKEMQERAVFRVDFYQSCHVGA